MSEKSKLHDIHFGTDGWRALIAKEFTYKNLEIFLNGLAMYLLENYGSNKPIVIGYDARFLADKFADFAAETLNSWGINALTIDHPVPTPVIAFAAEKYGSCGALMFTASHNPPEYMGIKYIPEYAGPASVAITDKILEKVELAAAGKFTKPATSSAKKEVINPREEYFAKIRTLVNFDAIKKANQSKKTKLIYDPLFGCGRNYTNVLLKEAGFDVETLHDLRDPTFGGSLPDPTEKRLTELKARILETGAALGAANDGDSDRFAFFDEAGVFYPANKSLSIILKYLIEERKFKGVVARTVATTHLLDAVARKFDVKVIETAVGFKWLCEIMRAQDTILCAEESGGMSILGHIPEKDGILAILLLAEVMAITGKKLSTLWEEVQEFAGVNFYYDRLDLHLDDKAGFMAKFDLSVGESQEASFLGETSEKLNAKRPNPALKDIAGFKVLNVDKTEGAKIYLDNGSWFLARPSGTEAMCRVYFEGNDKAQLDKLVAAVRDLI